MKTKKSQPRGKKKTVRKQAGLFDRDVLRAVTTEFIRNRERFYSPQIASNIVTDLRAQLIQGIDAGDRVSDLQARVRKVLVNDAPNRISRIIRTEINAGMNAGALESYKATQGRVSRKKWLTAGDILVRGNRPGDTFDHKAAHGQVVKVEDPFIVGGQRLQHPGDPSGSAANIIRCRCTTVPILLGQRLPRPKPVVAPAAPRPDAPPPPRPEREGRPFPIARPGQQPLPGFTETLPSGIPSAVPSVPQSIAPGVTTSALTPNATQLNMQSCIRRLMVKLLRLRTHSSSEVNGYNIQATRAEVRRISFAVDAQRFPFYWDSVYRDRSLLWLLRHLDRTLRLRLDRRGRVVRFLLPVLVNSLFQDSQRRFRLESLQRCRLFLSR